MPAMGAKNMPYPPIKVKKFVAVAIILHGTKTDAPITAATTQPRLILRYRGNKSKIVRCRNRIGCDIGAHLGDGLCEAAEKAAARPPFDPVSIQSMYIFSGLQISCP